MASTAFGGMTGHGPLLPGHGTLLQVVAHPPGAIEATAPAESRMARAGSCAGAPGRTARVRAALGRPALLPAQSRPSALRHDP